MIKTKHSSMTILAVCGVMAGCASSASAADTLKFEYRFSGGTEKLTGVANGTLAADGNHFTVTGFQSLKLDSIEVVKAGDAILLGSLDYIAGVGNGYNGDGTPVVTIDGSYFDLGFYERNAKHYRNVTTMSVGDVLAGLEGTEIQSQLRHPPIHAGDADTGRWSAKVITAP